MKPLLSCREIEDFILAYLDGELPALTRVRFEFHIAMCRECRSYLRDYRAAMALSADAFTEDDAQEVPEDLIQAILAAQKADESS